MQEKIARLQRILTPRYTMNPVATLEQVEAFEREHNCSLPGEYRALILQIGDGGPHKNGRVIGADALFEVNSPQGYMDCAALAPFPFIWTDSWLLTFGRDQNEEWEFIPTFEDYPNHAHAMSLKCWGCDVYDYLVLTGSEKGTIWQVLTENPEHATLLQAPDGQPLTILDWFESNLSQFAR